ncbi:hypothetical protein F4805DRAFT_477472 [Annulohypoxylon moriforme]|nr:hypothetical protein F4805DRAFT_477472 [Annulohypoxylon moriforme]
MAANIDNMNTSVADQKFFTTLFKYLPKAIDMDWEGFSQDMGFKNVQIAKTRFRQIRRKYAVSQPAGNSPQSPSKGNPYKVTKSKASRKGLAKKRGAGLNFSSDDDEKTTIKSDSQDDDKEKSIEGDDHGNENGLIKKEVTSD